jgi:hypothetical protein
MHFLSEIVLSRFPRDAQSKNLSVKTKSRREILLSAAARPKIRAEEKQRGSCAQNDNVLPNQKESLRSATNCVWPT